MTASDSTSEVLPDYSLLRALLGRRSRRFGLGMHIPGGPLAYRSKESPLPLTEAEEAILAFSACGITGHALEDLDYEQGGSRVAGLVGRTAGSADGIQNVVFVVSNDTATYLLRRPDDLTRPQIDEMTRLAEEGAFTELYRRTRVKIRDGRTVLPRETPSNLECNFWSLYAPGSTYFLPINDLSFFVINMLLDTFSESFGFFVMDERASFRPAGLRRFARSRGGHLRDALKEQAKGTVAFLENLAASTLCAEQGMMLQNVGLTVQAMGLGGFPHFSGHPFNWFEALGFRVNAMPIARYFGAGRFISAMLRLAGQNPPVHYPVGLERNGEVLLKAYCPPYYPSMEAAVRAVVARKWGPEGLFQKGSASGGAWRDGAAVTGRIPRCSDAAIDATISYCSYLYDRYGRFPVYYAPFFTLAGFQVTHVDVEFYDRFYRPQALTDAQREHLVKWHGGSQHDG